MKRNYLIIIIAIAALILAGIVVEFLLQKREAVPSSELVSPEEKFYSYIELPSRSGEFLEFDEAKSEIQILYLIPETMKVERETFRIDEKTIFSKMTFKPYRPNLFVKENLGKVKPEAQIIVFYLPLKKENEVPLARLIQVAISF